MGAYVILSKLVRRLSLASVARGGMVVVVFEFWENSDFTFVGLDGGGTDGTV